MSAAAVAKAEAVPIVIYRSVNRDGETYALEPRAMKRLREMFGTSAHPRPRVFIACEGASDRAFLETALAPQIVMLLTGMPEERLQAAGGVIFRDPVTERDLPRMPR